jgi:putative membrane protein
MIDLIIILCAAAGLILGAISGLTPGIHVNNFAAMLLAASPLLISNGLSPFHVAVVILAAAISQTFFDAIPAVFVGAPDSDTILTVLPGHSLMLEGRGIEAIRLSAMGSAGSIIAAILLVLPLSWIFSHYNDFLIKYVGVLLLAIAIFMIKTESGPVIEGQGSLVHLKYKALAILVFVISGLLGIFAFNHEDLFRSPLGLQPQPMLPLLSGLFGASFLIISLSSGTKIPEQEDTGLCIPAGSLLKSVLLGSFGGSVIAWVPGVSPSIAAMATRLGASYTGEEFLVSISGVNTANALFSLVALYAIDKPRSGAAAAIKELITLNWDALVQMLVIVLAVGAASYVAAIGSARIFARLISKLNYRNLCLGVLAGLSAMTLAFAGWFGLLIFVISTTIGMIAPLAGIRKTHAMGVLMLPLIVHYL